MSTYRGLSQTARDAIGVPVQRLDIHIPSAAMSARSGNYSTIGRLSAGGVFPKPVVYTAPGAGSSGQVRLSVAYLGDPA